LVALLLALWPAPGFAKQPGAAGGGPGPAPIAVIGVATSDFPAAGILNTSVDDCSATFVGCRTVLTAAHCVCNLGGTGPACPDGTNQLDSSELVVFLQHAGFFLPVRSVRVPPTYQFGTSSDIALLELAFPVRGVAPEPINLSSAPGAGTIGTIVGFGATSSGGADSGVKRVGSVTVGSCAGAGVPESNHICWSYDGTGSNTCLGDSGGPLFADLGAGSVLAGVHSGGVDTCNVGDTAFDADVFVDSLWIQMEAGADLGTSACGDGAQVGDPGVTAEGFGGVVTGQATGSFSVPTGTKLLRVALNAELGTTPNDFDLYVKAGAPPTLADFDCAPLLIGSFEFCEIPDPTTGTWHYLVDAFQGGPGEYQITVTSLPENPPPPSLVDGDFLATDFTAWELMRIDGLSGDRSILSSSLRGSGPALAAPEGVSTGPGGKIVLANLLDRSVLEIDPTTGDRSVVSGCVDAACSSEVGSGPTFLGPRFVAFGVAGAMLVGDRASDSVNAVVEVDPATGDRSIVSGCEDPTCATVRGSGPTLSTVFGIAVEASGDVVVANSYALIRIDPTTGNRTVLSGCTDASCTAQIGSGPAFGRPEELMRDGLGGFLVADGNRDVSPFRAIFHVDGATGQRTVVSGCADAACSTTVGTGPLFSSGLIGIAFTAGGDLLASDGAQRALFLVDPVSGNRSVFSGCVDGLCTSLAGAGTQLNDPLGITTIPEPDPALGLGACGLLLAALARWRRASGRRDLAP
jgi:hypothetical protein